MAKIEEIDKNLKVETSIKKDGITFIDAKNRKFSIFGLSCLDEYGYRRMPYSVAKEVSEGVEYLHTNTSGGRVVFETDSPYIAIKMKAKEITNFPHMPITGVRGFDLYTNEGDGFLYSGTFEPPVDIVDGYEGLLELNGKKNRKILINFPLYNNVDELYIGLDNESQVMPCNPYRELEPIVFYGSSITQGGCASRPGNNYPAIISRKYNVDFVCLGFSGSARGEQAMADYIAALPMSVFVMDYDHNSDAEELRKLHFNFYETVRKQKPNMPIIMVTAPNFDSDKVILSERREVILKSYKRALEQGDKNVYFIDGETLFGTQYRDCATVDGCHPNDYGFVNMADVIGKVVGEILDKN